MISFEDAIKQKVPFKSKRRSALLNTIYTANMLSDFLDEIFSTHDISSTQYNVLRIVNGASEKVSTSYIKDRMLVRSCDASRVVDRLITKGFLQKSLNKIDRRLVDVSLTKSGKLLINKVDKSLAQIDKKLSHITERECNQLNKLLNKIRN